MLYETAYQAPESDGHQNSHDRYPSKRWRHFEVECNDHNTYPDGKDFPKADKMAP